MQSNCCQNYQERLSLEDAVQALKLQTLEGFKDCKICMVLLKNSAKKILENHSRLIEHMKVSLPRQRLVEVLSTESWEEFHRRRDIKCGNIGASFPMFHVYFMS